jgi:hypothetical protein
MISLYWLFLIVPVSMVMGIILIVLLTMNEEDE